MNNLLGHLALRLGTHQELWATEALHFILHSSSAARQAFVAYVVEKTQVTLPKELSFRTQVTARDGSIPDLVATDDLNQTRIVIEAKFWAGLTDNQPIAYLKQVTPGPSSLLLFIAPTARLPTLWPEVLGRCVLAEMPPEPIAGQGDVYVTRVAGRTLAALGWRDLLAHLIHRLELMGELAAGADVRQLVGLCEHMDQAAFLPVRSEELAPQIGRRFAQFCDLVDDLTEQLKHEKLASTKRLKATGTKYWYGRYMMVHGYGCLLKVDYQLWGTVRETPFWFCVVWHHHDAIQRL